MLGLTQLVFQQRTRLERKRYLRRYQHTFSRSRVHRYAFKPLLCLKSAKSGNSHTVKVATTPLDCRNKSLQQLLHITLAAVQSFGQCFNKRFIIHSFELNANVAAPAKRLFPITKIVQGERKCKNVLAQFLLYRAEAYLIKSSARRAKKKQIHLIFLFRADAYPPYCRAVISWRLDNSHNAITHSGGHQNVILPREGVSKWINAATLLTIYKLQHLHLTM